MIRQARLLVGGIPLLVVLLWVFGMLAEGPSALPEPALLVKVLLPLSRLLSDTAAVLTVGCIVMGGLVVPGRSREVLAWGRNSSWGWVGLLLAQLLLTSLDTTAAPVTEGMSPASLIAFVTTTGAGQVLTAQLMGALFVALAVGLVHSRPAAWLVATIATMTAAVPGLLGHGGIAAGHVAAAVSLAIHLAAVCVWAGGLLVLVVIIRGGRHPVAPIVGRFSSLALLCALLVGESGLLNASLRLVAPSQLVTTDYGALVLVKGALFAALIALGWRQRSVALPRIVGGDLVGRQLLIRVAGWELTVMGVAIAASVAMSRLGPPPIVPAGGSMSPLAVVVLALGLPLVARLVGTPPAWGRRAPEVVAVGFLVLVIELGSLGLGQALLGQELGAVVAVALLSGAGWLFLGAIDGGAPWAVAVVGVGWPVAVWLAQRWSATPVSGKEAVFSVLLAWLILAAAVGTRRPAKRSAAPEPVAV